MTLYKPGDRVIVREDLSCVEYLMFDPDDPRSMPVVSAMLKYRGREVTIADIAKSGRGYFYSIAEDDGNFYWADDMFSDHVDDTPLEDDRSAWDSFFSDFFNERSGLNDDLSARR